MDPDGYTNRPTHPPNNNTYVTIHLLTPANYTTKQTQDEMPDQPTYHKHLCEAEKDAFWSKVPMNRHTDGSCSDQSIVPITVLLAPSTITRDVLLFHHKNVRKSAYENVIFRLPIDELVCQSTSNTGSSDGIMDPLDVEDMARALIWRRLSICA
ncbi:hypothetical protein LTR56_011887 [Elasticomyces elasticus]|nr:hypothetical protein LTR56_011887 [Elasticomyces elasticus]KAK3666385.1 hypothetical protein LTR22_002689 [Elasticomyces elasticus]KAK4931205.1 hypothetical protein LTR49_002262 [Elasticomyces elasticus]KAK5767864.1 hypothetical protein LTS12_002017 [Elasticomyces elasticus]